MECKPAKPCELVRSLVPASSVPKQTRSHLWFRFERLRSFHGTGSSRNRTGHVLCKSVFGTSSYFRRNLKFDEDSGTRRILGSSYGVEFEFINLKKGRNSEAFPRNCFCKFHSQRNIFWGKNSLANRETVRVPEFVLGPRPPVVVPEEHDGGGHNDGEDDDRADDRDYHSFRRYQKRKRQKNISYSFLVVNFTRLYIASMSVDISETFFIERHRLEQGFSRLRSLWEIL